jgi:hypothetical protein
MLLFRPVRMATMGRVKDPAWTTVYKVYRHVLAMGPQPIFDRWETLLQALLALMDALAGPGQRWQCWWPSLLSGGRKSR